MMEKLREYSKAARQFAARLRLHGIQLVETEEGGTYYVTRPGRHLPYGVYAPDEGVYYEHRANATMLTVCNKLGVDVSLWW
jgi:hypothetical protein